MPATTREQILEATYACVARYGLTRTTVEDVARQAGVGRATVYRYFPGGKEQLQRDTVAWEAARFLARLADATAGAPDLAAVLEQALLFAHRAVVEHEILQRMLQTEPEVLLPRLTLGGASLVHAIKLWLAPHLARAPLGPGMTVETAGEYLARMTLSFISAQGQWDLSDPTQVAELVRTEFVAGILAR